MARAWVQRLQLAQRVRALQLGRGRSTASDKAALTELRTWCARSDATATVLVLLADGVEVLNRVV